MKKYFGMFLAVVFVFVLAGCNGTVDEVEYDNDAAYEAQTDQTTQTTLPTQLYEEQNGNDMTQLEEIIAGIRFGMSRAEAEQLLGVPQRVAKAYGSGYLYRHDVMYAEGYSFVCPDGADGIDGEGLAQGLVRLIVFLDYNENDTVVYYALYYTGSDGMIYEARNRGDEHGRFTTPRPDMLVHGE